MSWMVRDSKSVWKQYKNEDSFKDCDILFGHIYIYVYLYYTRYGILIVLELWWRKLS